jgi:hypothetical protein
MRQQKKRGLFNIKRLNECIGSFKNGNDELAEVMWVLVNLELWYRIFIDNDVDVKREVSI